MEFEVKDMSCDGCANSIRRAVTGADPVAKLDIDVATKVVRIESALPSERLVAIIEEVGFHAKEWLIGVVGRPLKRFAAVLHIESVVLTGVLVAAAVLVSSPLPDTS